MEGLEDERQEVEPFEETVFPSARSIRNPGSRIFHGCLILPLVLVMALAITSLSYFAVTNEKVQDLPEVRKHDQKCVLFAHFSDTGNLLDLGPNGGCVFSIFGEVAVAVTAALLVVWMIIKTSAGFHLLVPHLLFLTISPAPVCRTIELDM